MRTLLLSTISVAAALAFVAIPTVATAHGGNNDANVVHACIGNVSKIVRIVGMSGVCLSSPPLVAETPAHWGIQGPQGAHGTNGTNGTNGAAGINGTNGTNGVNGLNGTNGLDGTSATFVGYFAGNQNGCPNGGAIFAAGSPSVNAYVCNGMNGGSPTRVAGACFDNFNRYVDCGNGTVTDTVTGLIWLKNANCFENLDWATASGAAAALAGGQCGLTDGSSAGDWRLPSKDEWTATIARGVALGCTGAARPPLTNDAGTACYGDGSMFAGVGTSELYLETGFFWSSSSYDVNPELAWVANLLLGIVNTAGQFTGLAHKWTNANHFRLWPVRGGR